jgi:hypothetical protein
MTTMYLNSEGARTVAMNPLTANLEILRKMIAFAHERGYHEIGYDVLAEAVAQLRAELPWVLVEVALPEEQADVIYYFAECGIFVGKYLGMTEHGPCFGGRSGFLTGDVTHWAYLTKPEQ